MQIPNAHYLIIDVEATCTNSGQFPRTEMEIIEIGALLLDARSYEVCSDFTAFIKPVRHPRLTAFCTELTTITQEQVDAAPPFAEAMQSLKGWLSPYDDALFCSWGDYDRKQFVQDCDYHGYAYPFGDGHLNLKKAFQRAMGLPKPNGITGTLYKLGLEFEGTKHRGIDDVRNIARIVQAVSEKV